MLTKQVKKEQVSALSKSFSESQATFLVNCIGLNVEEATTLRKTLKTKQANIKVIRNTLALRALEDHKDLKEIYAPLLKKTNAFVTASGSDPSEIAKILNELQKENEVFKIKKASLEGKALEPSQVVALANLPSKPVLQAQFLQVLQAPMSGFVRTLQEVPAGMVRVLNSYKQGKQ